MRRSVVSNKVAALSIAILLALVVLTISGVMAARASGTETRSLTSSADTQIVENAPTKNYGVATSLGVNGNDQSSIGKDKFALVKWDLSGIAPRTQINSASVTLNVTNSSTETYQAHVLKKPWVESEATWNVYSSGEPWEVAGAKDSLDKEATVAGSITPSVKGKNTLTLPVAVVQGWVDNPDTNQGIIIAYPSSTRGFNFNSREDTDPTQRPQLTLDLIPDAAPPETTIDSGPPGTISSGKASFTFSSSEAGSSYECSLDSAAYTACTSPKEYTDLSEGSHTFSVKATDAAGNTDASPASTTWTVDTTAPDTTIDSGPSGTISVAEATFAYSSEEGVTFECRLDGSAYSTCTSNKTKWYTKLSNGSHTFDVRAIDGAGNVDATPASRTFSVEVPPPPQGTTPPDTTITDGRSGTVNTRSADFSFSATEDGSTFECSLDGSDFEPCSSPKEYTDLSEGSHTFSVKATDAAGNTDASPASTTWTVDTTAPDTKIDSNPDALTNSASASFEFSSTEPGSGFQCKLDSGTYESCTSPNSLTGLSDGSHTFSVKATDTAGNSDATPDSYTWTVNTVAPQTTIDTKPTNPSNNASPSFTFSSNETGSTFECSLDGAAYARCTSPKSYSGLSEGSHTFSVRATDAAGNTDATPATQTFTVDTTAPAAPTITSGPADASTDTDGDFSFAFAGAEAGGTYQCSLDMGTASYSKCTSPMNYTGQANGSYSFRVRQVDDVGNVGAAKTRSFSVVSVALPVQPYPGVRWYPVMGVYKGASAFASETRLIDSQYADYVGAANENSYLDLGDSDAERYWFCGGRKYRMADFYVDDTVAPDTRAQAQDPNWQNYKWNQTDHLDAMLDNSTQVQAGKAKACLFVAFSATSNEGSVPQWMINDPDGLTWNGSGGDHVRMDKTEALQDVTDFYIALLKHYGNDERIAQLVIGEYYPGSGNPLTSAQTAIFRSNMEMFWADIIAAAPTDANGDRMAILQSNPIQGNGDVSVTDIRNIGIGVTGSDPDMFSGQDTDLLQRQLYGEVPLQHQANANRLVNGYKITWDGTPNPWAFTQGTTNAIRYEYLAWYHSTQGPTPYDSMLMRDDATLNAQWHGAYSQFGPNGSLAAVWGQVPNYP